MVQENGKYLLQSLTHKQAPLPAVGGASGNVSEVFTSRSTGLCVRVYMGHCIRINVIIMPAG